MLLSSTRHCLTCLMVKLHSHHWRAGQGASPIRDSQKGLGAGLGIRNNLTQDTISLNSSHHIDLSRFLPHPPWSSQASKHESKLQTSLCPCFPPVLPFLPSCPSAESVWIQSVSLCRTLSAPPSIKNELGGVSLTFSLSTTSIHG